MLVLIKAYPVVENFYNPWCTLVSYMFLQNFVNLYLFIQKFYDNNNLGVR